MAEELTYLVLEPGEYSDYTWHAFLQAPPDINIDACYATAYATASTTSGGNRDMYDVRERFIKVLELSGAKVLDVIPIHLGYYDAATPEQKASR